MNDVEWKTVSHAAGEIGVRIAKISELVKSGQVEAKRDPIDSRRKLVNMNQVRAYFGKNRSSSREE